MKIALLGDIAFYGKYSLENDKIFEYFKDVSDELKNFDFVVGNLETPFITEGIPYGAKSAHIRSIEQNVELLKFLNIGIVNLANNHIFDYGVSGYEKTKLILEDNEIKFFGIEDKVVYIVEDNNKIALSGYCCYSTNALGYPKEGNSIGVNALDGFIVEKELIRNHTNGYLNLLSIHAGEEHVNYPNIDHIELARIFASKVPYIYYGHHPHVMQGIEKVNDSLIAYSLGNFCFDDVYTKKSKVPLIKQTEENKNSFILSIEIIDNNIVNHEVIPIYLNHDKLEVFSEKTIKKLKIYSKALNLSSFEIEKMRKNILTNYYIKRKNKRNINWYFKRLNVNSLKIIINEKKNNKKYFKAITKYIQSRSNDE